MSQHTPEPWSYEAGKGYHEGTIVITSYTMPASSPLAHISNICDDAEPDARRIVACVNACRGIRTSILENSSTAKEPGISSSYEQIISEREFAISQRDELLAALKSLEKRAGHMAHQCGYFQDEVPELATARTAIAKFEAVK